MTTRYKCWCSRSDPELHLVCAEGKEAFEQLPVHIRNLGPWAGGKEGAITDLRLPYRLLIAEQQFVVLHRHVSQLDLEARTCDRWWKTDRALTVMAPAISISMAGFGRRPAGRCQGRGWLPPKR
jgi:hypothetical protein